MNLDIVDPKKRNKGGNGHAFSHINVISESKPYTASTPLSPPAMLVSTFYYNLKHTHHCQHWPGEREERSMSSVVNIGQGRGSGFKECVQIGEKNLFEVIL